MLSLWYLTIRSAMDKKEEQAPAKGAKLELVARFTLPDGRVIEKTVEAEGGIPSPEEFDVTDRGRFLATFDRYEQSVISARDQLAKIIGETVSEEIKKTSVRKE